MLRREAVIDGERDDVGLRGQRFDVVIVARAESGLNAEAPAVDIDEEGELVAGVGQLREEETGGDSCFRGEDDVLALNSSEWVVGGWDVVCGHEFFDSAVMVNFEKGEEEMGELAVAFLQFCQLVKAVG